MKMEMKLKSITEPGNLNAIYQWSGCVCLRKNVSELCMKANIAFIDLQRERERRVISSAIRDTLCH